MEWIADPSIWAGLVTLVVIELVLGIDNLVFIAILAEKLPPAQRDRARALYDERFCRMWEFYLAGAEMAFRHGRLMVFQIQLAHQRDAVPLTRDYLYAHGGAAAAEQPLCGQQA